MLDFDFEIEELSGIGDNFVNFVYSLALSNTQKKPMGKKVSNYVLSKALVKSGVRNRAKRRLKGHEMADFVEGIIFYAWVKRLITIEKCVEMLQKNLKRSDDYYELREVSIDAFAELLKFLEKEIWK